jgi:hypothetical protein
MLRRSVSSIFVALVSASCMGGKAQPVGGGGAGSAAGETGTKGGAGTTAAAGASGNAGRSGVVDAAAGAGGGAGNAGTSGVVGAAAGAGGGADAAAGVNGAGGANVAVPPPQHAPARNYQLTGTWPKLKAAIATRPGALTYKKIVVHDKFMAETCAIADYNDDGQPDISSGRRWYEGPQFKVAHVYRDGQDELPLPNGGAQTFQNTPDAAGEFPWDLDGDGWTDLIVVKARATAVGYRNPGLFAREVIDPPWRMRYIHVNPSGGEQQGLVDINGDGRPELFSSGTPPNSIGYYQVDWSDPDALWAYLPVAGRIFSSYGIHGLGFGDVDGDGLPDLIDRNGVRLQRPRATWNATTCPGELCGWVQATFYDGAVANERGGSHMYAADFDGDGDADIFSADWAHGWGLAWYEQQPGLTFVRHQIMATNSEADLAKYGPVAFSEPHALQVVDMDGDGVPDVVTGKSYLSSPTFPPAPDPMGKPVAYVFKTVRNKPDANGAPVTFEPHLVDDTLGVGMQFAVGHANTDGVLDLCVASKLGLAVFLGQ